MPTTDQILELLEAAEAEVRGILTSAASTVERLSKVPVCSEKALKDLSGQYLGHVRKVQEVLKSHAYILEDGEGPAQAGVGGGGEAAERASRLQQKLAQLEGTRRRRLALAQRNP